MNTTTDNPMAAPSGLLAQQASTTHVRPNALQGIALIVRRELGTFFRGRAGWIIAGLVLFLDGVFYNAFAVGSGSRYSTDVLSDFFFFSSGMTMAAAVVISMRLIAEERQNGSLPLLTTSSLSDGEIIVAKFLSGFLFLAILRLVTLYMPAMIFLNGKVSFGHIFAGYTGLMCMGAAAMAIGTFASAVSPSQIISVIVSAVLVVFLLLQWLLSRLVEGTLSDVVSYLSFHDKHFRPFMNGTIAMKDVVFYLSITVFFLALARNSLEGRRWKP